MADSDDWRVTISLSDQAQTGQAQRSFSLRQVEEDIRRQVGRSIAVGADDRQIFLYAGTETAARDAERIARDVLARHGIAAESALHRWHPMEEQWENPDVAMPQTEAERQAEHQRLEDTETAESVATGIAQWQVRVELGSHRQAVALARTLENEGRAVRIPLRERHGECFRKCCRGRWTQRRRTPKPVSRVAMTFPFLS